MRNKAMNKKMRKFRLVINTNVPKRWAFDVINAKLSQQLPQLESYVNNLGRMAPMDILLKSGEEEQEKDSLPDNRRQVTAAGQNDFAESGSGGEISVSANITFRAKGLKRSDVIIELTSPALSIEKVSGVELWILRSILWRLFDLTFPGLSR